MNFRIGHGYDVHAFEAGDHLVIGGVRVPYHKKFRAHSDGDVLIHALCDALLGAAAQGDIGQHFPDTDPQWKDVDSRYLLRSVYEKANEAGYVLVNADLTIVAQEPKLSAYLDEMCVNLVADLNASRQCINIKATTTEGLGSIGCCEGIACHAVVLMVEK